MDEPHNYRNVGYSMIAVAASLTIIALLYMAIGDDVLYGDKFQRSKTSVYEENKNQLEFNKFLEKSFVIIIKNKYENDLSNAFVNNNQ